MDDDRHSPEVVQTITDDTLEWLFKPRNMGELLCRLMGVEQFEAKIAEAAGYDGPDGIPHRLRDGPLLHAHVIIHNEKLYLEERRRRARNLVEELAKWDPKFPRECDGSLRCGMCSADDLDPEHDDDCLWARARKLIGLPVKWEE